jgi:hypothetical protein
MTILLWRKSSNERFLTPATELSSRPELQRSVVEGLRFFPPSSHADSKAPSMPPCYRTAAEVVP